MDDLWLTDDGIIMRRDAILLPFSLQKRALEYAHEGHLGIILSKRLLKSRVWFIGIDKSIEDMVNGCLPCQANVDTTQHAPLFLSEIPSQNTSLVSLDFSSRSPTNDYLLVANYERARFPAYSISKDLTAKQAIIHSRRIFEKYGFPEAVKTDNGPAFKSKEFNEFLTSLKIKHIKITPLNPEANGGCERLMEPINKCIRCASVESKDWKTIVKKWVKSYRATPHSSTGIAPELAMNRKSEFTRFPLVSAKDPTVVESILKKNDHASRLKQKHYADISNKAKSVKFYEGDHVLYKWSRSNKPMPILDPDAYTITKVSNNTIEAERPALTPTYLCRNCRFFKPINKTCFESSVRRRTKSLSPVKSFVISATINGQANVLDHQQMADNGLGARNMVQQYVEDLRVHDLRRERHPRVIFDANRA